MSALPEVTTGTFKTEVLGAGLPVLVDFWATWCGPCVKLAPVVEKIAQQYERTVRFFKLNTDEHPDVAGRYGITGIPCLILFKNGEEIDRLTGFDSGPRILAMLNKHISAT